VARTASSHCSFKTLATLRTDAQLFDDVEELRWRGPLPSFPSVAETIGDPRLATRMQNLAARLEDSTA